MSIKKYTNFENIDSKIDNQGNFIKKEDLFIISKNEIEKTEFGECKYDVMEVSVYDVNNNLLPQQSGNNVAYIKSGDIKNYVFDVTNKGGNSELVIDVETLLHDIGFTNGILKVNINFVRNKIGSENSLSRVWIQEISPSRQEIRILPLKTSDSSITNRNKDEFNNLKNLSKDFKYQKKALMDSIYSFENGFLSKIDDYLVTKYGNDFFNILKTDFGLSKFEDFRKKVFEDFKTSIDYYLNNKYYNISDSNFGRVSEIRFEDCNRYDFATIMNDIDSILFNCISHNSYFLKRRELTLKTIPKEFQITKLVKEIKDNLDSFDVFTQINRNVYNPSKVDFEFNDTATSDRLFKNRNLQIIEEDGPPPIIEPVEATVLKPAIINLNPILDEGPPPIPPTYTVEEPTPILGGGSGRTDRTLINPNIDYGNPTITFVDTNIQ
jgi:hypothetical protein